NRLVDAYNLIQAYETVFTYDVFGRLRVRQEYRTQSLSPLPGSTLLSETRYIYDGNRVIQERNGTNNTPLVSYTRGTDLSGSLEGAGGIGGLLARSHGYSSGTGNWTNHNFYHADGNGNITFMLDKNQTMVASYRYDPFGNTISSSGTLAAANLYRFSSKEIHLKSGMYYYLYRIYVPDLDRWMNQDPLQEEGFELSRRRTRNGQRPADLGRKAANPYVFCENALPNLMDPFGLDPMD